MPRAPHILTELPSPGAAAHDATFPGVIDPADALGAVVGPNTLGEYLTVVAVTTTPDGWPPVTVLGYAYGALAAPEHRRTAFGNLARANAHRPWKAVR